MQGSRSMVRGSRCMVQGAWCKAQGAGWSRATARGPIPIAVRNAGFFDGGPGSDGRRAEDGGSGVQGSVWSVATVPIPTAVRNAGFFDGGLGTVDRAAGGFQGTILLINLITP